MWVTISEGRGAPAKPGGNPRFPVGVRGPGPNTQLPRVPPRNILISTKVKYSRLGANPMNMETLKAP